MRWHQKTIVKRVNRCNPIFVAALLCSAALLLSPAARAQGDCKLVHDAIDKLSTVSNHAYEAESNPAQPGTGVTNHEVIRTGGTIYVLMSGKWRKSPLTPAQMRAQEEENWKNAKNVSCKHLRDESVKGESAAVYSTHNENEDSKEDGQVWVSKSKGLPLREEQDVDLGSGDKHHMSIRYEYTNVQAPAVSP